jgi:hypothetical protein
MLPTNLGTQVHGICIWVKTHYGVKTNCHNLTVFDTCGTLIYQGGCLENIL